MPTFRSLIDYKSLRIRFDKIDGFIRVYDGSRYLVLFGSEKGLDILLVLKVALHI